MRRSVLIAVAAAGVAAIYVKSRSGVDLGPASEGKAEWAPLTPAGEAKTTISEGEASPIADECPPGFPVKAKSASKIYHEQGGRNYDRTVPDRCFRDAVAAEAAGFRASKI